MDWHREVHSPSDMLEVKRQPDFFHDRTDLEQAFMRWKARSFGQKPTLEEIRAERDSINIYWNYDLDLMLEWYIRTMPPKEKLNG